MPATKKQNEWSNNRYKKFCLLLEELKTPCIICGESEPVCIDFHHVNPDEKELAVSQMNGWPKDKILAEISKCVTICSNCHRKVHAGIIQIPEDE